MESRLFLSGNPTAIQSQILATSIGRLPQSPNREAAASDWLAFDTEGGRRDLSSLRGGLDEELIDFVVDGNSYKQGRYMPGVHLPIYSPQALLEKLPDYTLLLALDFVDERAEYRQRGGRFIIPVPELKVVLRSTGRHVADFDEFEPCFSRYESASHALLSVSASYEVM